MTIILERLHRERERAVGVRGARRLRCGAEAVEGEVDGGEGRVGGEAARDGARAPPAADAAAAQRERLERRVGLERRAQLVDVGLAPAIWSDAVKMTSWAGCG